MVRNVTAGGARSRSGRLSCGALVLLAACAAAPPAQAAFPGQNGKIAFTRLQDGDRDIYTMNPDGTGQQNRTNNTAIDREPAWSPDGQKIAFSSRRDGDDEIHVMNADGTGVARLTNDPGFDTQPAWSPDGQRIAFTSSRDGNNEIYTMNADGTGVATRLTNDAGSDSQPAWSPNGQQIAFQSTRAGGCSEVFVMNANGTQPLQRTDGDCLESSGTPTWSPDGQQLAFVGGIGPNFEIFVMNADGTGVRVNRTNNPAGDALPAWSPDGQQIAFTSDRDGNFEIYTMNANGTGQLNRTNNGALDQEPDWQPLPSGGGCGNTRLQLGRATVEGALAETGPGTGAFRAGPGEVVFVGGLSCARALAARWWWTPLCASCARRARTWGSSSGASRCRSGWGRSRSTCRRRRSR